MVLYKSDGGEVKIEEVTLSDGSTRTRTIIAQGDAVTTEVRNVQYK